MHGNRSIPWIAAKLLCMASLLAAMGGCASSRLLKAPLPSIPTQSESASSADGMSVRVDALILRNGGGSWLKDANWDEYVLTIENDSEKTLNIEQISLVSEKLDAPVASSVAREELEARSSFALRTLKDVGIIAGVGIVAPSAVIVGAIGTGGGILSASAGAAALATAGLIAIPVGLIGASEYVVSRRHRDAADKILIQRQLTERGFALPLGLPPQTQRTHSAFFPITPAPRRLTVTYSTDAGTQELNVELPGLEGLHLKKRRGNQSAARGSVRDLGVTTPVRLRS